MTPLQSPFHSNPDLELSFLRASDAEAVALLHAELDHSSWSAKQWHEVQQQYPCSWVIKKEDLLLGYACYQTQVDQAELLNIGIHPDIQGQGIGADFLLATISLLPKTAKELYLEVRRSNIPAIGLYEKIGFQKVGERPAYYSVAGGTREDALIYKMVINA